MTAFDVNFFLHFICQRSGWDSYEADDPGPETSTEEIACVVMISDANVVVCCSVCPHHSGGKMIRLDAALE